MQAKGALELEARAAEDAAAEQVAEWRAFKEAAGDASTVVTHGLLVPSSH